MPSVSQFQKEIHSFVCCIQRIIGRRYQATRLCHGPKTFGLDTGQSISASISASLFLVAPINAHCEKRQQNELCASIRLLSNSCEISLLRSFQTQDWSNLLTRGILASNASVAFFKAVSTAPRSSILPMFSRAKVSKAFT